MGVNHGRAYIFVAEQLLNGTDVVATFKKMGGETVAKGMTAGGFAHAGLPNGVFNGILQIFLRQVMAPDRTRARVAGGFGSRKNVLPHPGALRIRIFAPEGMRQVHGASTLLKVQPMLGLDTGEMNAKRRPKATRQKSATVFPAFPANGDLVVTEIDVFHPQTNCFHKAKSGAIKELGQKTVILLNVRENSARFGGSENDRQFRWPTNPLDSGNEIQFPVENLLIEEEQCAQSLILSGS
jgi:hypothetical protein